MLIASVNDHRLRGDCLIQPFRFCMCHLRRSDNTTSKATDIAIKALASLALIPAAILAGVGVIIKWIDLGIKGDKLFYKGAAITYSLPLPLEIFSRLGDRLVAYLHVKYVAEKCGLPVYFTPFKGSEFFAFSQEEHLHYPQYFKKVVHLKSKEDIEKLHRIDATQSVLYVLPFFPDSPLEVGAFCYKDLTYPIDWESFKPRVKELLKVVKSYHLINIPEPAFSIALHVRTGGTYDSADTATMLPGKIPPLSYYRGELEKLMHSSYVPENKQIFIHIFTDDVSPSHICQQIQEGMKEGNPPEARITWSYSDTPVLIDDVANMTRFDALIRPDSNLSGTLSKAAEHLKVEISPRHFTVNAGWTKITIDRVGVKAEGEENTRTTQYTFPAIKRVFLPEIFYKWFHGRYLKNYQHEPRPIEKL